MPATPPPDLTVPWSPEDGADRANAVFAEHFGGTPDLITVAPGRVNLIGEHTDYNDGLCLPIALPYGTYVAVAAREDGRFRVASGEAGALWEGDADDLGTAEGWAAYAAGVVWALEQAGHRTTGLDVAVTGCVPLGAGLSSSAALECGVGLAVATLLDLPADAATRRIITEAGIRAENEVAGAATGGMDQTIAVGGEEGSALLLDTRSWETRLVPFAPEDDGLTLLVVDTRVHHSLNDGGYASRRTDCETAAAALGLSSLREASEVDLPRLDDERVRRRAKHIVTEIARVSAFADALERSGWAEAGALMVASHASMRDDFEISCPELDAVVDVAVAEGALGARMTGGGFGGSAIALVPTDRVDDVRRAIDAAYVANGWGAPGHLEGRAGPAARVLS